MNARQVVDALIDAVVAGDPEVIDGAFVAVGDVEPGELIIELFEATIREAGDADVEEIIAASEPQIPPTLLTMVLEKDAMAVVSMYDFDLLAILHSLVNLAAAVRVARG